MRMPYRTKLGECREAMKQTLDFFRFETKQGTLNDVAGILAGWIVFILVWAAVIVMALAIVAALLGPAE
jgi:hypothetical protein